MVNLTEDSVNSFVYKDFYGKWICCLVWGKEEKNLAYFDNYWQALDFISYNSKRVKACCDICGWTDRGKGFNHKRTKSNL